MRCTLQVVSLAGFKTGFLAVTVCIDTRLSRTRSTSGGTEAMRKYLNVLGLAISVLAAPIAAMANTTYDVNQVVGSGSVTGSITTDGATGTLSTSDLVD